VQRNVESRRSKLLVLREKLLSFFQSLSERLPLAIQGETFPVHAVRLGNMNNLSFRPWRKKERSKDKWLTLALLKVSSTLTLLFSPPPTDLDKRMSFSAFYLSGRDFDPFCTSSPACVHFKAPLSICKVHCKSKVSLCLTKHHAMRTY